MSRRERRLDKKLRRQGVDPNQAYCTECHTWYDVRDKALVRKHKH